MDEVCGLEARSGFLLVESEEIARRSGVRVYKNRLRLSSSLTRLDSSRARLNRSRRLIDSPWGCSRLPFQRNIEMVDLGLAERIRAKIEAGTLPLNIPVKKTYAGYGKENPCSGCGEKVYRGQVEYEGETDGATLRFHIGCHGL